MHVAVVTTFYPNAANPVRAVFLRNLVNALGRRADVTVVSPVPYAPPLRPVVRWRTLREIPAAVRDGDQDVLHPRYGVIPKCDPTSGFSYFLGALGTLRRLASTKPFDLLHAHCAFPDAVGVALAASCLGMPFAVTAHGSDINVLANRPLIRGQVKWALKRAAVVIAVSRALRQKISALVPSVESRLVHIPCAAVDPRLFAPRSRDEARRSLGLGHGGRTVVFAGRLVRIKAVDVLLRAWRLLRASDRLKADDHLVVIGDGPERSLLEAQATAAELRGTVRFLGDVPHERIACWLNAASVFCLPSRNEGTPNVIVEALASGCPVVASRVGGIPEVVSDGCNGLLVEAGSDIGLAEALGSALERGWDTRAIATSVSELTWDELASRNLAALQEALTREEKAACLH